MKISAVNRFELDEGDEFNLKFKESPNNNRLSKLSHLVIHATEGPNVAAAVSQFQTLKSTSTHLILGKDGKELVQLVDFNRAAVHANEYNEISIGIELDYPGDLRPVDKPEYRALNRYQPNEYILAKAINDGSFKFWPLYQKAQLDALLSISKKLVERYGLTTVAGHEELKSYKVDPGPAFPMIQFREKLLGVQEESTVLQETTRSVQIRSQPSPSSAVLNNSVIPARTPVSITNEKDDWCLIQVIAEIEGNPWLVGWVEKNSVTVRREPLAVTPSHRLVTHEGRKYPFIDIPTQNYGAKEKIEVHKYVIMHITTGTNMNSTINFFKDPVNQVSSHLLIGRDGKIAQFVPFDKVAYHAGYSWWEGNKSLNRFSIGIELDNAGFLRNVDGKWMRSSTVIPDDQVTMATHWRENRERAWHNFTQIQLDVALDVLRFLKETYGIEEILGHDQVNLRERLDPGPLFPLGDFRAKLFEGRLEPNIKIYHVTQESKIYANIDGKLPDLTHPTFNIEIEKDTIVAVSKIAGAWALIDVLKKSPGLKGKTGWVKSNSLHANENKEKTYTITSAQAFYRPLPTPPAAEILGGPFPASTRVRLQEDHNDWVLVALMDPVKTLKGLEGWIKKEFTDIP